MVVTIDCRDTINCKVTIVLCNGAQVIDTKDVPHPKNTFNSVPAIYMHTFLH